MTAIPDPKIYGGNEMYSPIRQPPPEHQPTADHGEARRQTLARARFNEWAHNPLRETCVHATPDAAAVLIYGSSTQHTRVIRCPRCSQIARKNLPRPGFDGLTQCQSCHVNYTATLTEVQLDGGPLTVVVSICADCQR